MHSLRKKVYEALAINAHGNRNLRFSANLFIIGLIALNSLAIMLRSVPELRDDPQLDAFFKEFETFSVLVFTVEYGLRVWSCVENKKYHHPLWGRLRYMVSLWALVDLLAILPFYLTLYITDFGLIRMLRVMRLVRLYRMSKYSKALNMIKKAVEYTKEELILSYTFLLFSMVLASSIIYYLEHPAQPEAFPSIPASLWWGVVTMTTVGYGDVYPITVLGKIFGGFIAFLGIALFSLPTGILASGFMEQVNQNKKRGEKHTKCPHCGEDISI
ncbi:ion transporter [Telluribacter humicola]|uniref:ion transporter n=1 Tax=Telluribacter humicola TaxID=1720261 RepID=UPI001A95EF71|nr:ion transporter [Telluribacter humicola]